LADRVEHREVVSADREDIEDREYREEDSGDRVCHLHHHGEEEAADA
jgi:hypothetical protein